ncbi:MAG: response regulator [Bacteroidales bacterium]|nr:response regulator [Bacteroidales bacterium]
MQEIKKIPKLQHIPVVVVSAKQEQEDIDYVLSLGALDFIKKPISIDNLYLRIKEILESI